MPPNIFDLAQKAYDGLVSDHRCDRFKLFRAPEMLSEHEILEKTRVWSVGLFQVIFTYFNDWLANPQLAQPFLCIASYSMDLVMLQQAIALTGMSLNMDEGRRYSAETISPLLCYILSILDRITENETGGGE